MSQRFLLVNDSPLYVDMASIKLIGHEADGGNYVVSVNTGTDFKVTRMGSFAAEADAQAAAQKLAQAIGSLDPADL